jgi:hypothetical protein
MKFTCALKYFFLFLGLQIAVDAVFILMPLELRKTFFETLYNTWLNIGEAISPSGPGGHAMAGGAILGFLIGMIVYSLVPALIVCFFKSRSE